MTQKKATINKPEPPIQVKSPRLKSKRKSKRDSQLEKLKENKPYIFELVRKNTNPSIAGRHYPVQYIIKGNEVIFDSETKTNRSIRFAPGEASIFTDKQSKVVKRSSIVFKNGRIMVRKNQPHLYEYLMMSNMNQDNPHRDPTAEAVFKLVDSVKDMSADIAFAEKQLDAVNLIFNLEQDKLLAHSMVMGVDINRSISEIKYDLKIMAEKDPNKFLAEFNDPKAERKYHVLVAEDYEIIGHDHYQYYWLRGGEKHTIVNLPIGKNPLDYFINFLYEKDGEVVYSQIMKEISE